MLSVELKESLGHTDAETDLFPYAEDFTYRRHTGKLFELAGHVASGEQEDADLLVRWTGSNFKYEIDADDQLTWTDGNITRETFFIDGESTVEIRFDPPTRNEDFIGAFNYRVERGFTFRGNSFDNFLEGENGPDKIVGRDGEDELLGLSGRDSLNGGNGDDTLDGGTGADFMSGGLGDDTYHVQNKGDILVEKAGKTGLDHVQSEISFRLADHFETLELTGSRDLHAYGTRWKNEIRGNTGDNLIKGQGGNDLLFGGNGDDTLQGGNGSDTISGGKGADTFLFKNLRELGDGDHPEDLFGFTHGVDTFDMAGVDANRTVAGNQAFSFIGEEKFTGTAGELRHDDGVVYGDVNGDKRLDFVIIIGDYSGLDAGDFIL